MRASYNAMQKEAFQMVLYTESTEKEQIKRSWLECENII
jgi:hypothetical protein